MSGEFGTGKTIFVLAIVVGCFAVLWPKVFYPMLTASGTLPAVVTKQESSHWIHNSNKEFLVKLCFILEEHQHYAHPPDSGARVMQRWRSQDECFEALEVACDLTLTESILEGFKDGDAQENNLTDCMADAYGTSAQMVSNAAPPVVKHKHYESDTSAPRAERSSHLHPDMVHPALRDKGRALPQRTIDKQARPGPMPGVRPPMGGGAGHIASSQQVKGNNSMSVIMPLYTVGIIIFFLYTIMKVLFKKCPEDEEDEKSPKLKDFHLDPEYRKYVFAEEYLDSGDTSAAGGDRANPYARKQHDHHREASAGLRRRVPQEHGDAKIEDEQMEQLRRRLEDTERAMERLMSQMGSVSDKLTAAKITEVLSQAQAQAKLLKTEASAVSSKGSSPDMDEYEVIQKDLTSVTQTESQATTKLPAGDDSSTPNILQEGGSEVLQSGIEEIEETITEKIASPSPALTSKSPSSPQDEKLSQYSQDAKPSSVAQMSDGKSPISLEDCALGNPCSSPVSLTDIQDKAEEELEEELEEEIEEIEEEEESASLVEDDSQEKNKL